MGPLRRLPVLLLAAPVLFALFVRIEWVANHPARRGADGRLRAWTTWRDAVAREVAWYRACPLEEGYPRFATMTFMDGRYRRIESRPSFIPAMQDGMGVLSYLRYHAWDGKRDARLLETARSLATYVLHEASTPDEGAWPRFPRSTGWASRFPQPPDCGSQLDRPHEIQPDKGAIAAYAYEALAAATGETRWRDEALHVARVLARAMRDAGADRSPWPFRADWRTGEARGEVAGNQTFALRLFDALLAAGHEEFRAPRERLWTWIRGFQIPSAAGDGSLWAQFFEDHDEPRNRTAWAPLHLARYLLERRDTLDPAWRAHVETLLAFVEANFATESHGVRTCGEQDLDLAPWGGVETTYGAVLAMYARATGSAAHAAHAREVLDHALYATDSDGCPADGAWCGGRGGWQEDCHTDKLHNFVEAMEAFPEWADQ